MTALSTCADCPAELTKYQRKRERCESCYAKWRRSRPGHCSACGNALEDESGPSHDRCKAARRDIWHKYKRKIYDAYGNRCNCCGEADPRFLTIDHVDGGGAQHRRSVGGGNRQMMLSIIKQGYPDLYQLLCFNCNCGRARNGGVCPHSESVDLFLAKEAA